MHLNNFFVKNSKISFFLVFVYIFLYLIGFFVTYSIIEYNYILYFSFVFFGINFIFFTYKKMIIKNHILILSFIFFIVSFFSVIFQKIFLFESYDGFGRNSILYIFNILLVSVMWWGIGFNLANLKIKRNYLLSFFIFLFLLVCIGLNVNSGYLVDYYYIRTMHNDYTLTHLSVGDYVVFLLIFLGLFSRLNFILWAVISSVLIIFFGGRSSFYFMIISFLLIGFLNLIKYKKVKYSYIFYASFSLITLLLVLIYFFNESKILENNLISRMLLVGGLDNDFSINERKYIFSKSLENLIYQMPFGDASFIANTFGNMGNYIHNVLSVWQFYGFTAFVIILIIMIRLSILINKVNPYINILLCYTLLCLIFSKQINFYLFWLVVGFFSNQYALMSVKRENNILPSK